MGRKLRKMLIGSILMIALGLYLAYDGYSAATDGIEQFAGTLERTSDHVAPETIDLLTKGGPLSVWARGTRMLQCTVEGGEGAVELAPPEPLTIPGPAGEDFHLVGGVQVMPGRYVVTCQSPEGARFGGGLLPVEQFRGSAAALATGVVIGGVVLVLGVIFFLVALVRRSTWTRGPGRDAASRRGGRPAGTSTGWEHLVVRGSPALPGYPVPPELSERPPPSPPPLPPPVDQEAEPVR